MTGIRKRSTEPRVDQKKWDAWSKQMNDNLRERTRKEKEMGGVDKVTYGRPQMPKRKK